MPLSFSTHKRSLRHCCLARGSKPNAAFISWSVHAALQIDQVAVRKLCMRILYELVPCPESRRDVPAWVLLFPLRGRMRLHHHHQTRQCPLALCRWLPAMHQSFTVLVRSIGKDADNDQQNYKVRSKAWYVTRATAGFGTDRSVDVGHQ